MYPMYRGRIIIARAGEIVHSEALSSHDSVEMLVHQDAAQVYRFFAEDGPCNATVIAQDIDRVRYFARTASDATFYEF